MNSAIKKRTSATCESKGYKGKLDYFPYEVDTFHFK